MISLAKQLMRSGLGSSEEIARWIARSEVSLNGSPGQAEQVLEPGMCVGLRGVEFEVVALEQLPRLVLKPITELPGDKITGLRRVHAGLHKCLTMYTRNVMKRVAREHTGDPWQFRHFFHRSDAFYRECGNYAFASISGHAIDLDRFEDIRVSRFIRDPRDLLVSGYFYHKRGAEHWANFRNPHPDEWEVIGAPVPPSLPPGLSLSAYLGEASVEQGLLLEIEFRRQHFDSMRHWPSHDPRVRCYRYEDIVGNEKRVFTDLFRFYELPWRQRRLGLKWALKLRANKRGKEYAHIRDPRHGQWQTHFTPAVSRRFDQEFGDLLEQLGYR